MRFSTVLAAAWQRKGSLRSLRGDPSAQVVALYLMTCEQATASGLFYLPFPLLCHETGLDEKPAREALARVEAKGLCRWDEDSSTFYLPDRGVVQVGEILAATDNRAKGIAAQVRDMRELSPLFPDFWRDYGTRWSEALTKHGVSEPLGRGSEGASEPQVPVEVPVPVQEEKKGKPKEEAVDVVSALEILGRFIPGAQEFPGIAHALQSYLELRRGRKWTVRRTWWEKNVVGWREDGFDAAEIFAALRAADRSEWQSINPRKAYDTRPAALRAPPAPPAGPPATLDQALAEIEHAAQEIGADEEERDRVLFRMREIAEGPIALAFGLGWFGNTDHRERDNWRAARRKREREK